MYDDFTEKGINAVRIAEQVARCCKSDCVGSEHLLAGLCDKKSGRASKLLLSHGITSDLVKQSIDPSLSVHDSLLGLEQAPLVLSRRVGRLLQNSLKYSKVAGHSAVDSTHILLTLLEDEDSKAFQICKALGAPVKEMYEELRNELGNVFDR